MLSQAAGSAYVEFGNTKVMAGMCAHRAAKYALFCLARLGRAQPCSPAPCATKRDSKSYAGPVSLYTHAGACKQRTSNFVFEWPPDMDRGRATGARRSTTRGACSAT